MLARRLARSFTRRLAPGAVGLGLALAAPAIAHAGNGIHPRTPVTWEGAPCMTVVDRSMTTIMPLPYGIPYEDTEVTEDEVPDSRQHQFLAYCRQKTTEELHPVWLSWADVEAASMTDPPLQDPATVEDDEVLDTHPEWSMCSARITGDDERRPITFEMADEGVVWDTTEVEAGVWSVYGYTWEPPFNLYSPRPGVVKLIDSPDPADDLPAVAIMTNEVTPYADQTVPINICTDALEGSTITASYVDTDDDTRTWVPFIENEPVEDGEHVLDFTPPIELAGSFLMLRVEITDPMGRTYTAHMRDLATVVAGNPPGCDSDGSSFFVDPDCEGETTGGTSDSDSAGDTQGSGTDGGTGTGGSGEGSGGSDGSGGGCRVDRAGSGGGALALLVLAGLGAVGRRRRAC